MSKRIAITGIGAVTPVGLSAPATAAALRASIARLDAITSSLVDGESGTSVPAVGGRVPLEWFDGGPLIEEWPGHERFGTPVPPPEHLFVEDGAARLVRMSCFAAREAWGEAGTVGRISSTCALFLGLSEHEAPGTGEHIAQEVTRALDGFRPALTDIKAEGRASFLLAVDRAATAIDSGRVDAAVVGCVDSLVRPAELSRLASEGILRDPAINPQGILPGEGAAFIVLEKEPRSARPLAWIEGSAAAIERTAGTDSPNQGKGLTACVRAARDAASLETMPLVICDLNGNRLRALEWAMAQTRVFGDLPWRADLPTSGETWHPADCIGDSGAASGGIDCVWAIDALNRGYALTDEVVVWGASDGRLRAALILSREE